MGNKQIIIESYNNNWPKIFSIEHNNILLILKDKNITIEHIGSTSVASLAAKPVIDIMVGVDSLQIADECVKPLEMIGYRYIQKYEDSFPKRRFFQKDDKTSPDETNMHFHLHMVTKNSDFWNRQIFFRNYLRKNHQTAKEYQQLKEKLAQKFKDNSQKYCEAKTDFITNILAKNSNFRNDKKVNNKGIELWTRSFGDKNNEAILLITGAHAPSTFWPDIFCKKLVDAGYFVVIYDHRDIGYSTHFPVIKNISEPPYDLFDLTNDALAILEGYKINNANIIGHSMGGNIVQYLAAFYPKKILKAISISVSADNQTNKHSSYDATMKELLKNKPTGDFNKDWRGWKHSLQLLHGSKYEFDEEIAKKYVASIYDQHHSDYHPAWNHIAAQQNKTNVLDKLPNNMLFISGTEDIFTPYEEIKKLSNRFNVEIIEGAGHIFFNKNLWDLILKKILEYLLIN